jgi:hypothetical protein
MPGAVFFIILFEFQEIPAYPYNYVPAKILSSIYIFEKTIPGNEAFGN